jgi:hypothetical protein
MKIKPVTIPGWIDGFTLGMSGVCKDFYRSGDRSINDALSGIGKITTPKTKTHEGYEQLTLELLTDDDETAGVLRIELHVRRKGADLIFSERCAISGNGMILMRGALGHTACGAFSFDGKANVLGAQHMRLNPIERQLPLLVEAFEYARDALTTAFPGWSPDALWLKRAEACFDLPIENAIAAARVVQHSTLCGAIERQVDKYRRISDAEVRGIPVIRFMQHATGPEEKIYPKRDHDLRLEITCRDRDAITRLTGVERAIFSSDGARTLFLNFVNAATPRLNLLVQHARAALEGETSITNVLVRLKPIIDRAAGERKVKGPASNQAMVTASRLLDALLATGMCDALGAHSRHAIRRDLDALCEEDGPLIRHPSRAIYYLKPTFARACAAVRLPAFGSATVQL